MMKRPAHAVRGWLYCAATGLLLMGPALVHAQTRAAGNVPQPPVTRADEETSQGNPLFGAVKRELSKLQPHKSKETTKKHAPTLRQPGLQPGQHGENRLPTFGQVHQNANRVPVPRLREPIEQTAGRQPAATRTRKPGLLDRLFGRDKPQTSSRRVTEQQNAPQRSNGIPGLIPDFLKPKSNQSQVPVPVLNQNPQQPQVTAKHLATPDATPQQNTMRQPVTQPPTLILKNTASAAPRLDDLNNPFPELSEAEADGTPADGSPFDVEPVATQPQGMPEVQPEVQAEVQPSVEPGDDPFTGLKLDEPQDFQKPVVKSVAGTSDDPSNVESASTPADSAPPFPAEETAGQTDAGSEKEEKLDRLTNREKLTGFKGFCPVTLRDKRDLVDADADITAKYEGKTYTFSTAEAKKNFQLNPTKYAPVKAGHDVIVLIEGGVELEGTLEYAVWFKDRLYLFSSAATLETFVGNPAKYAKAIETEPAVEPELGSETETGEE